MWWQQGLYAPQGVELEQTGPITTRETIVKATSSQPSAARCPTISLSTLNYMCCFSSSRLIITINTVQFRGTGPVDSATAVGVHMGHDPGNLLSPPPHY